jgi:outer membrane lipoprotein-sorting protein
MYFQIGTEWQSTPYTTQQSVDTLTEMWKQAVQTCHKTGNEAVNGEAVTVFAVHTESKGAPSDSRVWVSNRSGLALKSESQLRGGITAILTYRYDNIQAPPGIH